MAINTINGPNKFSPLYVDAARSRFRAVCATTDLLSTITKVNVELNCQRAKRLTDSREVVLEIANGARIAVSVYRAIIFEISIRIHLPLTKRERSMDYYQD